jgi:hypothetical protein
MENPKRIAVLDSSALLACLQNFTDPHQPSLSVLEQLMAPNADGERLIDQILIPDHIFYELTGILPISLKFMHEKFATARDNPKALESLIEMYTQASPRGDKNDAGGKIKNHVRALLHFVAHHPESLVPTHAAEEYCKRLKADYSMLCAHSESDLTHYRPTFADAFHHLGKDFHATDLRVHIGQLMMMGLITEREYNERMGHEEKEGGHKKRFILTREMLNRLTMNAAPQGTTSYTPESALAVGHERGLITKPARDTIEKKEAEYHHKSGKRADKLQDYLTLGFFERYPILDASLQGYRQKERSQLHRKQVEKAKPSNQRIYEAVGPSPLLVEHYCFGGILPDSNAALLTIARALHVEVSDLEPHADMHIIRKKLHERGFFEISPTFRQLCEIQEALTHASINAPVLARFIQGVIHQPESLRNRFNNACKPGTNTGESLPYEKVFTHALVNRTLTWDNFLQLLVQSHSMHDGQGILSSVTGDILIDRQSGTLYLDTHGIEGRHGMHPLGYMATPLEHRMVNGTIRSYYRISHDELLDRAWRELTPPAHFPKRVSPIFEAMLTPAVKRDAAAVREVACNILGEEPLLQMEKDFANRYARKHLSNTPPYRSTIAALHTTSRITRKNLGEVATLEVAQKVTEQTPEAHVWLINHDSDLFPDTATGKPQLETSIARQHTGLLPKLSLLNECCRNNPKLHFVNTTQFLDTISILLGHDPKRSSQWVHHDSTGDGNRKPYHVLDRAIVRRESMSWKSQIQHEAEQRLRR